MLKGHTKIELTNVDTGEKEIHEHDNIVTVALEKNLNELSKMKSYSEVNTRMLPINNLGLGGILLFENELTAETNNITMPSDKENHLVGYASNDAYSGSDTRRGSRNSSESGAIDGGYKYVWDFSTSQANGQISALSLTHSVCGATPYGYNAWQYFESLGSNNFPSSDDSGIIRYGAVDYDFDNRILTAIQFESSRQLNIIKYRIPLDVLRVNSKMLSLEKISTEPVTLSTDINVNSALAVDDNYYYFATTGNNTSSTVSSKTLTVCRIQKNGYIYDTDFGKKQKTFNNSISINNSNRYITIMNNYLYVSTGGTIYKISLNDFDVMYQFTYGTTSSNGIVFASYGEKTMIGDKYVLFDTDTTPNVIERYMPSNMTGILQSGENVVFINKDGFIVSINKTYGTIYLGSLLNYLGTINNLGTPVEKTSAQTMKITYTLTESTV